MKKTKKKFSKKQNARYFAIKDRVNRNIAKYGKAYVDKVNKYGSMYT